MEKHILIWSYWLGLVCTAIAFVLKLLNAFGIWVPNVAKGNRIDYGSFLHVAALFFLIAIATASYIWAHSQRSS